MSTAIWLYSWVLIIYALMSWIPQLARTRFGYVMHVLVDPYLRLFDRIPTRIGIFDFRVLLGYIVLQILLYVVTWI
ncbi:MAG: YggT family protein [Streptococcaceae bacterium]|nr:YggT family protein [Streptococcaceae bacterium]